MMLVTSFHILVSMLELCSFLELSAPSSAKSFSHQDEVRLWSLFQKSLYPGVVNFMFRV